jgi:hypothetical protein
MNKTLCDRCKSAEIRYQREICRGLSKSIDFHLCWDCHRALEILLGHTMEVFLAPQMSKPKSFIQQIRDWWSR